MTLKFLQPKEGETILVMADPLRELMSRIFQHLGVSNEDSDIVSDILVTADLRGVDTHGIFYNPKRNYIPRLSNGEINPNPKEEVVNETAATALIDGDQGLGHPAAYKGMNVAIRKAREVGVGLVSIRNSSHLGMLAYYPSMAVQQGMVGMIMTAGGGRIVLPVNGAESMMSTNPLSIGAPAGRHPSFLLDMATSVVAGGKIEVADFLKVAIPKGWALDKHLNPTTDSNVAWQTRKLLPLGDSRELGGHKGFGLSLAVDILCGVLSGNGYTPIVPDGSMSHFLLVIDIAAMRSLEDFKAEMDEMIDAFHSSPKAPGHDRISIAGELEWQELNKREKNGIPFHREIVKWLKSVAEEIGLDTTLLEKTPQ